MSIAPDITQVNTQIDAAQIPETHTAPPPAPSALDIARVAAENGTLDAATWCLLAIAEELHTLNTRRA
jgi:hypothetical protein